MSGPWDAHIQKHVYVPEAYQSDGTDLYLDDDSAHIQDHIQDVNIQAGLLGLAAAAVYIQAICMPVKYLAQACARCRH